MVNVVYDFEELATFELPYSEKESAFPYIETLADMMWYLSTESSLNDVNIYRGGSKRNTISDELNEIKVSYPITVENAIGETRVDTKDTFYCRSKYFYIDRQDLVNLSNGCSKMIKDGVTNPNKDFLEPIMFYGSSFYYEGSMKSMDLTFDRKRGLVRLEAHDDGLKVSCLANPTKVNDNDVDLFVETLSYANHKNVPITFNHSGLEKKSSEHEKSYHTRFKSFRFNQYEKVDNLIDNTVDSVGSFFSGLYKKGKDWLKN